MRDKPVYPNVRCGAGHPDAPGYIVCDHVIDGKAAPDPLRFRPPARDKLGIISCSLGVRELRPPERLDKLECLKTRADITCRLIPRPSLKAR